MLPRPLLFVKGLVTKGNGALKESLGQKAAGTATKNADLTGAIGFQGMIKKDLAATFRYIRMRQRQSYEHRAMVMKRGKAWGDRFDASGKLNVHYSPVCYFLSRRLSYFAHYDLFIGAYGALRVVVALVFDVFGFWCCRSKKKAKAMTAYQNSMFMPYYELKPLDNPRMYLLIIEDLDKCSATEVANRVGRG